MATTYKNRHTICPNMPKSLQTHAKIIANTHAKIIANICQKDCEIITNHGKHIPTTYQDHAKFMPKTYQHHAKIMLKSCQTHAKNIPKIISTSWQKHAKNMPKTYPLRFVAGHHAVRVSLVPPSLRVPKHGVGGRGVSL